jgi:hypothetical protein
MAKGWNFYERARVSWKEQARQPSDPWCRLFAAVLLRAIKDLGHPDALVQVDALAFLVEDGALYLEACGLGSAATRSLAWIDVIKKIAAIEEQND